MLLIDFDDYDTGAASAAVLINIRRQGATTTTTSAAGISGSRITRS
jgi:hypothetical protein